MRMGSCKTQTLQVIFSVCLLASIRSAAAEPDAAPAAAELEGPSNTVCLECHRGSLERSGGRRRLTPVGNAFATSVHGQMDMGCVDCHTDLRGAKMPHAAKLARPDCSQCHEDAAKDYDESVHAQARKRSPDSDAAWCADCHGMHDIRSAKDPKSSTYHLNLARTCAKCHANEAIIAKAHITAGNVPARFQDSIHGLALYKSGMLQAPNCASCHGNHAILRAADPKSRVNRAHVPATCGTCHAGILTTYEGSVHGAALRAGNARAAVCTDCHTAHETTAVSEAWKAGLVKECGTCHVESMRTFRDTFHGKVTTLGFTRAATCADCHGAHGILAKKDPNSMVAPANRAKTCGKCHTGASEKFALYDPHADAHNRGHSPLLFEVSRSMKLLLVGTFAFFGLHTILWLVRSLLSARRRRPKDTKA
jgi:hypothetical protein